MSQWFECTLNDIGEIVGGATPLTAKKSTMEGKFPGLHQKIYPPTKTDILQKASAILPKQD